MAITSTPVTAPWLQRSYERTGPDWRKELNSRQAEQTKCEATEKAATDRLTELNARAVSLAQETAQSLKEAKGEATASDTATLTLEPAWLDIIHNPVSAVDAWAKPVGRWWARYTIQEQALKHLTDNVIPLQKAALRKARIETLRAKTDMFEVAALLSLAETCDALKAAEQLEGNLFFCGGRSEAMIDACAVARKAQNEASSRPY